LSAISCAACLVSGLRQNLNASARFSTSTSRYGIGFEPEPEDAIRFPQNGWLEQCG
jgi:hypothetical protein